MHRLAAAILALATLALGASGAHAESDATKVKAAQLATLHAKQILVRDMRGGGSVGTVTLQPIGRTRTRVTLHFTGTNYPHAIVTLHRGTDCNDNPFLARSLLSTLNPTNSASQVSQTIVDLPLENLSSGNYLIDVRNATQTEQFVHACARLR